jgi:hypothetical protein
MSIIVSPKDAPNMLSLISVDQKLILNFEVLTAPLNTQMILLYIDIDKPINILKNYTRIRQAIENIKSMYTADPWSAFLSKSINTFIICTDASNFGTGPTLGQI